jgi:hypothetical protein
MKKNEMKTQELTKSEVDQIQLRVDLANLKYKEMTQLEIEYKIIQESARNYLNNLINKYKLDNTKKYKFDGNSLIEVEEEEDVQSEKKVQNTK